MTLDGYLAECEGYFMAYKLTSPATISELQDLLSRLPGPDESAAAAARARELKLTKPQGALGRLEDIAEWMSSWQGQHPPRTENIQVRVFAANHGVVKHGVSAFPPEVTAQMVANFKAGGAAVNQLAIDANAELSVVAFDLNLPSSDFTEEPSLDEERFMRAIQKGMKSVPSRASLLCIGEMGIGNTTSAAAICLGLFGGQPTDWTGRGTGIDNIALAKKTKIIETAVKTRLKKNAGGLEILRCLGGLELVAMAGAVLAARIKRIPVLLDGFVAGAAVAPLHVVQQGSLDHCMAAHVSAEPGHRRLLKKIHKQPLLDLGLRLGEASGATLAIPLLRAACACHNGMATFTEAAVSGRKTTTEEKRKR
tara:strand:+ start:5638 stop:6735 length:1098 start_codon:yes stop_codon:yes gene_type:complete